MNGFAAVCPTARPKSPATTAAVGTAVFGKGWCRKECLGDTCVCVVYPPIYYGCKSSPPSGICLTKIAAGVTQKVVFFSIFLLLCLHSISYSTWIQQRFPLRLCVLSRELPRFPLRDRGSFGYVIRRSLIGDPHAPTNDPNAMSVTNHSMYICIQIRATSTGKTDPPEVVINDMDPAGQQHLSLSKTTVLRAHQIEPFVEGLKEAVKSSRRWGNSYFYIRQVRMHFSFWCHKHPGEQGVLFRPGVELRHGTC